MSSAPIGPVGSGPAFLGYGFRPFFLGAALWAAIAIALWVGMLTTGFQLPSRFDPLSWHIHEMLFGFVLAAVAGFLLTAIPNWTGRPPLSGAPLAILTSLWLLGRAVWLISGWVPAWVAIAADLSFPVALAAIVAREIMVSGNRRNVPIIAPVTVLAVADLLMDLRLEGFGDASSYGWRLGLTAILILISVVGGRIVPNFTRNWLTSSRRLPLPPVPGTIDRVSLGLLHASLLGWVIAPTATLVGAGLLCASIVNLWRLIRWQWIATRSEPLLLVLHVGYAWLVVGAAALGVAVLDSRFPLGAAVHALTAGAIGTMVLAVMTRATRGHSGRALTADWATTLIYTLVVLAAAVRIGAAMTDSIRLDLVLGSAALWIGAFGLFTLRYAPLLLRARSTP